MNASADAGPWRAIEAEAESEALPSIWHVRGSDDSFEATLCEFWSGEHDNEKMAKLVVRLLNEASTFPKERNVGRMGEMAPPGDMQLQVHMQEDGDLVVHVSEREHERYLYASCEFCTVGPGGGRSPRTRAALVALMVAIEADNEETPHRAFPQPRLHTAAATATAAVSGTD